MADEPPVMERKIMSQAHDIYVSKKAEYDTATKNVTDLISRYLKFCGSAD